jgi:hypothetical protein
MTAPMLRSSRFVLVATVIVSMFVMQTPVFALLQEPVQSPGSQQPAQAPTDSSSSQNSTSATPNSETPDLPDAPQPAQAQTAPQSHDSQGQQSSQAPAGAAAAKAPHVQGAPASEPVGAAIAPAKQSQRRSLWIKVGLVAGAGIALGTALALSKGSPSRPPGTQAASTHP